MKKLLITLVVLAMAINVDAAVKRSAKAKRDFQRETPCPATGQPTGKCPGYVIDHVIPLACGGPDQPSNMQWQTYTSAKRKDKWERKNCK